MKFGVMYGGAGPWATALGAETLARTVEELGFDSVWAADHVVVAADELTDRYKSSGGSWELSPEYPIMDPMVWLGFAAAVTKRISLATGVLVMPLRPPALLAKQVSSLDVLSGGRVILGLGSGWISEELAACGVRFEDRVALLEEGIEVMRTLWKGPGASYQGTFTNFDRVTLAPRPAAGSVPIVIGGRVPAAARRAGRLGDGFFPHTPDLDLLEKLFATVRATAADSGRDPNAVELIAGGARTPADLETMMSMGVSHIVLSPRAREPSALHESLEKYQKTVIEPVLGRV
jgi:probable F420-dependent oxidoreductase